MNEKLNKIAKLITDPGVQIDVTGFTFALLISALVGLFVSALYQFFYEDRATGTQIHRSFLLMSPSITALFIAIQFSLPLSLGLLGALSIIRFRTPVKDPEEVGFIMLLIAGSVVCATFQFILLGVLLGLATALLLAVKYIPRISGFKRKQGTLLITLNGEHDDTAKTNIIRQLDAKLVNGKLESVSFVENLTTIHYSFSGMNGDSINGLFSELKKDAPIQKLNVYYNKQGGLF